MIYVGTPTRYMANRRWWLFMDTHKNSLTPGTKVPNVFNKQMYDDPTSMYPYKFIQSKKTVKLYHVLNSVFNWDVL